MSTESKTRTRHELAADGVLITSGLFAMVAAILLPLFWLFSDQPLAEGSQAAETPLAAFMNLAMLATTVVGPWLTWTLHKRQLTWKVVVAAVASVPAATLMSGAALPLLNRVLHPLVQLVSDAEYAAPIAVGVLAGIAYLWVISRSVRATFFEYGGPVALIRTHQASLIGIALLVTELAVGIGRMGVDGSVAEALAFGMLFGFGGGAAVYAADLVSD